MTESNNLNDESFVRAAVERVLDGDVEAFAIIVHAYQRLIAADLARRLPAQDVQEVAQDVFVRAYRALPSYRQQAPLRIWLLRIARYAAMDFWRKHYRRRDRVFSDLDEAALHGVESAHQQTVAERQTDDDALEIAREWLALALEQLSPSDRAVITLVELEKTPLATAAEQLGCSLTAMKVRAFRARQRLKTALEDQRPKRN